MARLPKIDAITQVESDWIRAQLADAREFVNAELEQRGKALPSPELLDEAFHHWLRPGIEAAEANIVINCIGVAFGQHLVNQSPLDWVIATDKKGSELAVFGLPGTADVLAYPQNFVAKRFPQGDPGFIVQGVREILDRVSPLDDSPSTRQRRWRR